MSSARDDARYQEVAPLGSGGMATVTLAQDTMLGRRVALKRVHAHATGDQQGLKRLRREALVGASLNHPNLVAVYDVHGDDDAELVIVMQYVDGDTLRDVILGRGALPAPEALRILEGVAAGLDAIHDQGIVHRDVKPANILLGNDGQVKLADLGIAAVADRTQITTAGAVVGTFSYMAPEQLDGRPADPRVDVYALAAVAFEILCGQKARPESNPLALAHAIATLPPPDLRDRVASASAGAAAVLQRGMASDPSQRPATAGELVKRLKATLDPKTTEPVVRRPGPPAPVTRRHTGSTPLIPPPAARQPATSPPMARQPAAPPAPARQPAAPPPVPRPSGSARGQAAADEHVRRPGERNKSRAAVAAVAGLVAVAVLVAALSSGGASGSHRTVRSAQGAHRAAGAAQSPSTRGASTGPAAGSAPGARGGTASSSRASAGGQTGASGAGAAPGNAVTAGAGSPSGAVQTFYGDAASHNYRAAWALADTNLRSQLGGFDSFQAQQSAVRSITFHRAQTRPGASPASATVELQTTSVLTDKTQQCAGTARTLRPPGGTWLLDRISIDCTPP
ncbi:MAG: serine/threonine-protein kinase [Solirubrobacteraceae bacterium]